MKKAKKLKARLPQIVWLLSGIFLGAAALLGFVLLLHETNAGSKMAIGR